MNEGLAFPEYHMKKPNTNPHIPPEDQPTYIPGTGLNTSIANALGTAFPRLRSPIARIFVIRYRESFPPMKKST